LSGCRSGAEALRARGLGEGLDRLDAV